MWNVVSGVTRARAAHQNQWRRGRGEESETICAGLCHLGIAGAPAQHQRWLGDELGCLARRPSVGLQLGCLQKLRGVGECELQEVKGRSCTCSTGLRPGKTNVSRNFSSERKKTPHNEVEGSVLWSHMCARLFHFKEGNPMIIKPFVLVF